MKTQPSPFQEDYAVHGRSKSTQNMIFCGNRGDDGFPGRWTSGQARFESTIFFFPRMWDCYGSVSHSGCASASCGTGGQRRGSVVERNITSANPSDFKKKGASTQISPGTFASPALQVYSLASNCFIPPLQYSFTCSALWLTWLLFCLYFFFLLFLNVLLNVT